MTYEEAIDIIHGFQKYGSKLGLERMSKLMDLLGNPQNQMKVIHVAGTNGKGSVCRYLYTVLQENGYKAGLYTSPYLERFTERIEFNGNEISPEDLVQYTSLVLEKVVEMMAEGFESPTEFELITAIGFVYFANQDIDFLLLEVGMGGYGDSTNVVDKPLASVITSISYDHMDYLGDTLEKIAEQKAGILKDSVPVVFHVEDSEAAKVIRDIAEEKGCPIYDVSGIRAEHIDKSMDGYTFDVQIGETDYKRVSIAMIGMHQVANAICALTVIEILKTHYHIAMDTEKVYTGIRKARQTGRLEVIKINPYVIIDGAHNEAGAAALETAVKEHFSGRKILMVIGMLADKEIDHIIGRFGQIADDFIITEPDNPRKLTAAALTEKVEAIGKRCVAIPDIEEACKYAMERRNSYDAVIFAGSLYLIGKVRGIVRDEKE